MCSPGKVVAFPKVSMSSPGCKAELEKSLELESGGAEESCDDGFRGGEIQTSSPQKLPSEIVKLLLPGLLPASVCKSVRTLWLTQIDDQEQPGKRSERNEFKKRTISGNCSVR